MKRRVGLVVALTVCAAAEAAEPAVVPPAQTPPAASDSRPAVKKPLDLRIGDVRKYMLPNEFRESLAAPDADTNTVVVEAKRELLPVKYEKQIPRGLMPLFWALRNPANSWRILLPDINQGPIGPPEEVVPPPVFRWGP